MEAVRSKHVCLWLVGLVAAFLIAVFALIGCASQPTNVATEPATEASSESSNDAKDTAETEKAEEAEKPAEAEKTAESSSEVKTETAGETSSSSEAESAPASSTATESQTASPTESENATQVEQSPKAAEASTPNAPTDKKVLVAYFSNTGTTEGIADEIVNKLGADTFAITPEDPYTSDDLNWRDETSRVSVEHEAPSLQDIPLVQVTPDNFEDYDVVFVGYPIWWQDVSWVMNGFVEGNDFEGKTVVPFCTSMASDLGDSAIHLAQRANGGDWLEGMRFSSSTTPQEVDAWIDSLDL